MSTESLMTTEEFEELARLAGHVSEGVRLEFIDGKLGAKAVPDGDHGRIVQWLIRTFLLLRPELWLSPDQGLQVSGYRTGRARPDGTLADAEAFVGQGEWAAADPVIMVVEVTSYDEDTDRRDRKDKPRAYAETGIPVYLLIDRDACEVIVHSEPVEGRYERVLRVSFGVTVHLPEPVDITLDTEPLTQWVS